MNHSPVSSNYHLHQAPQTPCQRTDVDKYPIVKYGLSPMLVPFRRDMPRGHALPNLCPQEQGCDVSVPPFELVKEVQPQLLQAL